MKVTITMTVSVATVNVRVAFKRRFSRRSNQYDSYKPLS